MDTPRALKWTIFLGAAASVVYLCLRILSPFFNVLAWASVLAITFYPVHVYLLRRTGHVAFSALVSSGLVVVAFVIPLVLLAGLAVNQFVVLSGSLQQAFLAGPGVDPATPWARAYGWLAPRLGLDATAVVAWIREHANELTRVLAQYTIAIAASVTGAIASFVFIIFAMFLLFRDGHRIVHAIPDILPFERARSEALLVRIREVIHGGVYGVVVIALLQGVLCGAMLWALGVPSAALWGMVTVVTSVIPLVGAAAVWVPAAIYLLVAGQWVSAIVLGVWGAVVISSVDNLLRPRLVGGRVGLSELVMFFALLGGIQVFGVLGIILGPVVFAIAASIFEVLSDRSAIAPGDASLPAAPDETP